MHFLDPTNDYAFKKVFGNENKKDLLIHFLNSMLNRHGEEIITNVVLLNPNQAPHIKGSKATILDVRCTDQKGSEYIVEMQVLKQSYFDKRVLYYAAKNYSCQIDEGDNYDNLRPVIFLGILNFTFSKDPDPISSHKIYNFESNEHIIKDLTFTFVELPKFAKQECELVTIADKWIYFLKHAKQLETIPDIIYEEAIKEAFSIVDRLNWSKEDLEVYENRIMALRDEHARLQYSYTEGREKGLTEGREQGLTEGREKGLTEGREQGLTEGLKKGRERTMHKLAEKMLRRGSSVEDIIALTELSKEQIQTIEKTFIPAHENASGKIS